MAGGGNGLSKARRIPIEVPEGAERGSQPAGSRAAGLRGRHCNHRNLCWGGLWIPDPGADGPPRGLRLRPIVPHPRWPVCHPGDGSAVNCTRILTRRRTRAPVSPAPPRHAGRGTVPLRLAPTAFVPCLRRRPHWLRMQAEAARGCSPRHPPREGRQPGLGRWSRPRRVAVAAPELAARPAPARSLRPMLIGG